MKMRDIIRIVETHTISEGIVHKDESGLVIHKNPTARVAANLLEMATAKSLRGTLDEEKDYLYIWDADLATHNIMEDIFEIYGMRIDIWPSRINVAVYGEETDFRQHQSYYIKAFGIDPKSSEEEVKAKLLLGHAALAQASPRLKKTFPGIRITADWKFMQ